MKSSQAVAIWLFERLGLDGAITGDFLEECAREHSAMWCWKQVFAALRTATWKTLRDHKVLALRAVGTGVAAESVLRFAWKVFPHLPQFSIEWWTAGSLYTLLVQATVGWIVARTHRTYPIQMVFAFLFCSLVWYFFNPSYIHLFKGLLLNSGTNPLSRRYLALYADLPILVSVGVLAGGIWGASPGERTRDVKSGH